MLTNASSKGSLLNLSGGEIDVRREIGSRLRDASLARLDLGWRATSCIWDSERIERIEAESEERRSLR